jgi:cytochrome c556
MRSTARWLAIVSIGLLAFTPSVVRSGEHKHDLSKLPAGPIRDRHELMEGLGQQAENINNAFSIGAEGFDTSIIQQAGTAISMAAHQIPSLFPKGSTDPNSRALPAIWTNWDKFEELAKQLEHQGMSLSNAAGAEDDENLKEKANKMFATCKSCHDQFRKPKDKKKGN